MKLSQFYFIILILAVAMATSCRVVKMGQLYLSENHQKPKQHHVDIANNPSDVFRFTEGNPDIHDFISEIAYTKYSKKSETYPLTSYLDKKTKTTAFIVIRSDTILYEAYFEGYNENSLLPSWSVAKSFTSALAGIAIQEGLIKPSDKLTKYLPELNAHHSYWNELTIDHLLNMQSGIDFNEENYWNPYSSVADLYMSKDIRKLLKKIKFKSKPGARHYYSSLDTELLGLALERALDQPLSNYLQEKIWKPLGMESNATWTVDSRKANNTKAFCCLNVTLRDYAKFARLYLKKGNWNGIHVIDSSWIKKSIQPNFENNCYQNQWYSQKNYDYYQDSLGKYQLSTFKDSISAQDEIENHLFQRPVKQRKNDSEWIIRNCGPHFYALGIFGQEVYVDPESEMIFIRLGKKWDTSSNHIFKLIKRELDKSNR